MAFNTGTFGKAMILLVGLGPSAAFSLFDVTIRLEDEYLININLLLAQ